MIVYLNGLLVDSVLQTGLASQGTEFIENMVIELDSSNSNLVRVAPTLQVLHSQDKVPL